MDTSDVLIDAFGRVRGVVGDVVTGLTPEQLAIRPYRTANSIAWLVWHLTRIEDDHVSDISGADQVWTAQDWVGRFRLPFDPSATGYGHGADEVTAVRVDPPDLLLRYHDAVHDQTVRYLETVHEVELDRIVDASWDPPVSAGVRLVSVISDVLQHGGQAAYVRGLVLSR